MDLNTFESLCKTENKARLYFKKYCWKNSHIFCIACRSYKIYRIADKRYRCKRCGYKFHDFTDRWINKVKISYKKWLWIIKLFELEVSARKIAQQVQLSYPTVLKAVTIIRIALVATSKDAKDLFNGEIELDESYFGGRRKGKREPSLSCR
jgi:transposase